MDININIERYKHIQAHIHIYIKRGKQNNTHTYRVSFCELRNTHTHTHIGEEFGLDVRALNLNWDCGFKWGSLWSVNIPQELLCRLKIRDLLFVLSS